MAGSADARCCRHVSVAELGVLIGGCPTIDLDDWMANTSYNSCTRCAKTWPSSVHRVCATLCSCCCRQALLCLGLPTISSPPRGRHELAALISVHAVSSLLRSSCKLTWLSLCCCRETLQVQWFWSTVKALTDRQRSQVLAFVTSSCAPPAGGFAYLRGFNGARHTFEIHLVSSQGDARQVRSVRPDLPGNTRVSTAIVACPWLVQYCAHWEHSCCWRCSTSQPKLPLCKGAAA